MTVSLREREGERRVWFCVCLSRCVGIHVWVRGKEGGDRKRERERPGRKRDWGKERKERYEKTSKKDPNLHTNVATLHNNSEFQTNTERIKSNRNYAFERLPRSRFCSNDVIRYFHIMVLPDLRSIQKTLDCPSSIGVPEVTSISIHLILQLQRPVSSNYLIINILSHIQD